MLMKRLLLCFFVLFSLHSTAQVTSVKLGQNTVVKDTAGVVYPAAVWQTLLRKGSHKLQSIDPRNPSAGFYLVPQGVEEREKRLAAMPKPRPSESFRTGAKLPLFNTTDINGNKLKLREAKGKIIVMNFWFIGCKPCRMEMPELNEMVASFEGNDNVIFVGYALDQRADLKDFLKTNPFDYSIIENSRFEAGKYGVKLFPTHVVIDPEGKVFFHTSGLAPNTVYWVKKSINELLASYAVKSAAMN